MNPPLPTPVGWFDHLRGILVLLHIVAVMGMAMPAPKQFTGEDPLSRPEVAGPVKVWEETLPLPKGMLRSIVLLGGRTLEQTRSRFVRWSDPYSDWAGVYQSWHMFGSSPARSNRMECWLEEEGQWRLLYRPLDPQARWRAEIWENGRVRGMIPALRKAKGGEWAAFGRSLARRAAQDFPKATRFKIQRIPLKFPPPEELRTLRHLEEGEPEGVVTVELHP